MIGNRIYPFDVLESTNDYIKENINKLSNGDIVIAKRQTKGRGRRGNVWESSEGNLYFSFLLNQNIESYENIFDVLMKVSVCILVLLKKYEISAKIKYPNDIIVNNKKIAGILIETIGNERPNCLIVGIGLNVNQKEFKKLNNRAISLLLANDKVYRLNKILDDFITTYNKPYSEKYIHSEYIKNSVVINRIVKHEGEDYLITGISKKGELELLKDNKKIYVNSNLISLSELYE